MIDFKNADYLKLKLVPNETFVPMIAPMFIEGEQAIQAFQTMRDGIVFTNKTYFLQSMFKELPVRKRFYLSSI